MPFSYLGNLMLAAGAASWWVVLEWIRGWFLTGFTWNYLGVALHRNIAMMQLAALGGVHLLSWLIVWVNVMVALGMERLALRSATPARWGNFEILTALAVTAVAFAYGLFLALIWPSQDRPEIRYACIQPNVPENAYAPAMSTDEILSRHAKLTEFAAKDNPQLVIWPEADMGEMVMREGPLGSLVEGIRRDAKFDLLVGSEDLEGNRLFNSAFLFSPGDGAPQKYDKVKLVFFGEYTPLGDTFPILRKLVPYSTDFSPGRGPVKMEMPGTGTTFCPLICFEDTMADLGRRAGKLRPDLLINITNDSWFKNSPGAEQHLANAVFRTVENDVPMIRCGNTGVTCLINQHGVEIKRLAPGTEGILSGTVTWNPPHETPYQRFGDWIVFLSAGICFALGIRLKRPIR